MTKRELNVLVEDLIAIRDYYRNELTREDSNRLADACNVIYHSIDKIAGDEE